MGRFPKEKLINTPRTMNARTNIDPAAPRSTFPVQYVTIKQHTTVSEGIHDLCFGLMRSGALSGIEEERAAVHTLMSSLRLTWRQAARVWAHERATFRP